MSKYKAIYSADAKDDLKNIVMYIKYDLKEPNIAKNISKRIRQAVKNISENPMIYEVIDDDIIKQLELRKRVVGNYLIFYRVIDSSKEIQVVRIFYGKRNWLKLL